MAPVWVAALYLYLQWKKREKVMLSEDVSQPEDIVSKQFPCFVFPQPFRKPL